MKIPLNLRQLQHLLLLGEELHFAKAAERAFLSQSAFSRSIQALEVAVGLRLFDRDLRRVQPTLAGVRLISRARRLLSSANDLSVEMDLLRSGDLGDVSVGVGPFSGVSLMPGPLAQMQRDHPSVKVRLDVTDGRTLLQHLDEERIEFFVAEVRELPQRDDCSVEKLGWLAGALFCRADHPLSKKSHLCLADFKDARFATVHMPASMKKSLDGLMQARGGGEFSIALECESIVILRDFALASDVIMLAFPNTVQHEVDAGLLKKLLVRELDEKDSGTPLRTEFGLVRLLDRTATPASEILMSLICREAQSRLN